MDTSLAGTGPFRRERTMISDWLSAGGRKADEQMGCARYDRGRLALCFSEETEDREAHWFLMGGADGPQDIPPDVALAMLRDRAREWLEANTDGWSGGLFSGRYWIQTFSLEVGEWTHCGNPDDDWDGCLIAAILAQKEGDR